MNHKARATTIVGRGLPKTLILNGGKLRVDVSAFHAALVREVARGLRQVERAAHRRAIQRAAIHVAGRVKNTTDATAIETLNGAWRAVLKELEGDV